MELRHYLSPKKSLLADLRVAADIVSTILKELTDLAKPDAPLAMLDEYAARRVKELGAVAYNKDYKPAWANVPYPQTLCTSVNHEICHGTARDRFLQQGDIVCFDLGIKYKEGCGDAAVTVAVGEISNRKERLMRYAKESLYEGINVIKAGTPVAAIGNAISKYAETRGFSICREFGGHFIGKEMHDSVGIPMFNDPSAKGVLKEGQVICIEPMLRPGHGRIAINAIDQWTFFNADGQPSAMFEHMILVTKEGYEILTSHL